MEKQSGKSEEKVREKKRSEEQVRESQKKEDVGARKGTKVSKLYFFQCFAEDRKVGLLKWRVRSQLAR